MPKAWLARFGRTVGTQALEAVGARMQGASGGDHVTVGGFALPLGGGAAPEEDEATALDALDALEALARGDAPPAPQARSMSGRELLLGSTFQLSAGGDEPGAPLWTGWGRFATGGFDAEVDDARMDGSVTTWFLGADVARARWLAGIALGLSEGEGDYAHVEAGSGGAVDSTLTAVYPYARAGLTDKVDVWGLAGYGTGELELTHAHEGGPQERYRTDISMTMGAAGLRGEVLSAAEPGGLTVAVKSDAFWVRTESDAVAAVPGRHGRLEAAEADVTRVRLLVESSRRFEAGAGTLTPSLELGLRHDGGDAETGAGVELGAGLAYAGEGFSVAGSVRTLVAHEASGYGEWGASGTIRIDPGASGRGLSLTVAPVWGAAASGTERLWGHADARAIAPDAEFEAASRLEAEVGYGLGLEGRAGRAHALRRASRSPTVRAARCAQAPAGRSRRAPRSGSRGRARRQAPTPRPSTGSCCGACSAGSAWPSARAVA